MIALQAYMQVKPEFRDEFLEKVQPLIQGSRAEKGNISYALFEEAENSNHFVMLEEWEDQEAIDIHSQAPHFVEFIGNAEKLLAAPLSLKRFDQ